MRIEQEDIDKIKAGFDKMISKNDFLELLNLAKPMIYGEKTVPFQMKQITWYSSQRSENKRYIEFKIKKKSGGERKINVPVKGLKSIQKTLSFVLQCVFEPHNSAYGFIRGKSIVDNANIHAGSYYVYNIDLKDFFPSVDQARVWKCLQLHPFNLINDYPYRNFSKHCKKNSFAYKESQRNKICSTERLSIANMISSICCAQMEVERKNENGDWQIFSKNVLPQGAPTSPILTNVVCQKLDFLLTGVSKRFGLKYSRYADDITFSSMHNAFQSGSEFLLELNRIILQQNFSINERKTRLQKNGFRMEVTGLLVNEKTNVQHRYIKNLRMWLYYWERYGYDKAYQYFLQSYNQNKTYLKPGKPNMTNIIAGKLDYLKMVKGSDNELFLKLKYRFDALTLKSDSLSKIPTKPEIRIKRQPENPKIQDNVDSKKRLTLPIVHNPQDLVSLLKNFSINDSALKYTTHSWDAGRDAHMFKDITEFLSIAKDQYTRFSYNLNRLSRNLNGKIYHFIFDKDISSEGWGDIDHKKRIYFGWSSPELIEACTLDASLNPEDYILPDKYQVQHKGKILQKFKHVIDVFKNEIEIRDENSTLLNLILQKHDKFLLSFDDPLIQNLDNKTFYTDVQWLSKALDLIFENIQSRPQHKQVYYSVSDVGNAYVFEILHVGSFNEGKSVDDEKLKLVKGNFGDIVNYLKNLCDWSIESKFAEGSFRINYLTSDKEASAVQDIPFVNGFKHILTFYK